MRQISAKLKDIEAASLFITLNREQDFEIDVKVGRYLIDGKSVLGIVGMAVGADIIISLITDDERLAEEYCRKLGKILS